MADPNDRSRSATSNPWLWGVAGAGLALLTLVALQSGLLQSGPRRWLAGLYISSYWLGVLLLCILLLGLIGRRINGRWLGAMIDARNKLSLSRLQVALWTMVVLSAYLTIAIPRIFDRPTTPDELDSKDPLVRDCTERLKRETPTRSFESDPVKANECDAGPLQITFPPELLLALGISMTSFAGSSLIQNTKKKKEVNLQAKNSSLVALEQKRAKAESELAAAQEALNAALAKKNQTTTAMDAAIANATAATLEQVKKEADARKQAATKEHADAAAAFQTAQEAFTKADTDHKQAADELEKAETEAEGLLHKNPDPADARWSDLFSGDELSNYRLVDMSKVQMFFFTMVVILAYGVAIGALLDNRAALLHLLGVNFPPFSDSLNALLGISHAGYLSVKTVDQTKTAA